MVTGDEVEVEAESDPEPRVVAEPADLAHALDADPLARAASNRLAYGLKLQHVRVLTGEVLGTWLGPGGLLECDVVTGQGVETGGEHPVVGVHLLADARVVAGP